MKTYTLEEASILLKPHVLRRRSKLLKLARLLKYLGRMALTNFSLEVMQKDRPEGSQEIESVFQWMRTIRGLG